MKQLILSFSLLVTATISNAQWIGINPLITTSNVGIGITTPLEKLHLGGSIRGNQPGGALRINTDFGNVNIGAQNPNYCNFFTSLPAYLFDKSVIFQSAIGTGNANNFDLMTNNTVKLRLDGTTGMLSNPSGDFSIGIYSFPTPVLKINHLTGEIKISPSPTNLTNSPIFSVDGVMRAREIFVNLDVWPDYVFDSRYKLMSLSELERYIKSNKHLPSVPTVSEALLEKGISVGQTQKILLEKIEELTLYIIKLNNEVELLKEQE